MLNKLSVVSGQWLVDGGSSSSVLATASKEQGTKDNGQRIAAIRRCGISLLEVLICIGVVAIGLVSIAALIPVGGLQVQRANTEERKGTLGLNAFREFQIRGMDKVENWVRYNSPNWVSYNNPPLTLTAPNYSDFQYLPPVAIDPLMVAIGQNAGASAAAAVSTFPANYTSGPLMPRLTLNSLCSISGPTYVANRSLADAVFTAADDVVTNIPDDASQFGVPGQMYADPPINSAPLKNDFNGAFTWLATLTPNLPNTVPNSSGSMQPPQAGDQYTLSVVVFDRRILTTPVAANLEGGQEEMVQAVSATPAAVSVGGGEFTLVDSSANAFSKLSMVRPEQWLMLTRYVPYLFSGTSYPWIEAKWYRIVAVSDITQSGTTYSRQVTLDGADWEPDPTSSIPPATVTWPASVPVGFQNYNTYACLFDGAVGVFQKVIHLEGPSNWSQ